VRSRVRRCRPGRGVQFAADDLRHEVVWKGGQILVRRGPIEGWNARHVLHDTSSSRMRRARGHGTRTMYSGRNSPEFECGACRRLKNPPPLGSTRWQILRTERPSPDGVGSDPHICGPDPTYNGGHRLLAALLHAAAQLFVVPPVRAPSPRTGRRLFSDYFASVLLQSRVQSEDSLRHPLHLGTAIFRSSFSRCHGNRPWVNLS
jgi:hypothetical protein